LNTVHRRCFAGLALLVASCGGTSEPPNAPKPAAPAPLPAAPPANASPSASPAPPAAPLAQGRPCGELGCVAFDEPEQAFAMVLAEKPRVLGVGEAHAQKSAPGVRSATRRFGEQLLPELKGRSSDIVIELLLASGSCGKQREEAVAERQKPVTEPQAATNQNQFVTLGKVAKSFSIEPHALEPTCEEYQAVLDAGSGDIARLLTLVADTTTREVEKVLSRAGADPNQIVVVYGGAIHNDVSPSAERADWSFGPRFEQRTGGRYVELDLIVPEFIKDTDTWRALPWYSHYDVARDGASAVLFRPLPHSFVLIFPRTPAAAVPPRASSAEP
jgi:hypothetical protein